MNLLSSLFNKGATLLKQSEVLADKFMTVRPLNPAGAVQQADTALVIQDDAQARVLLAVHSKVDSLVRRYQMAVAVSGLAYCRRLTLATLHHIHKLGDGHGSVTALHQDQAVATGNHTAL